MGDNSHSGHYLYWLKFGRDFEDIIRNTPTICIPDDHDVGQANLWGEGGKRSPNRNGNQGGYYMPVAYVQEVERAQTSHLPDPGHDTRQFDAPEAKLLGERQLQFLEDWTTDWQNAEMKAVLSQTIFAQGCNYSGKHEKELLADFDSNGWPQTGRNKALAVIRKSYACMVAGDQHLGTVIHHGIDDWNDAGYSFCVPSIANYWLRWWDPKRPGNNRQPGAPRYTGEFLDGFQNQITMLAAANPTVDEKAEGGKLSTRAAGFGIVRFNKAARTTTFECWPRNTDITDPANGQYDGWPVTVSQKDNFPMRDGIRLPAIEVSKPNQVVTVKSQSTGEVISSLRIQGQQCKPTVFIRAPIRSMLVRVRQNEQSQG